MTIDDLPPTQFEIDQRRHSLIGAQNDIRERRRVAKQNRAAGKPEPKAGDKLFVSIGDRTISRRSRAGVRFEGKGARTTVTVLDETDEEIKTNQTMGQDVVNVWGAEQILADDALNINQRQVPPEELEAIKRENAALEEENRTMREENRRLREARQGAKDEGDGAPSRLIAQREAKAKLDADRAKTTQSVDFGKDPDKK
jgi:hypothetical protein